MDLPTLPPKTRTSPPPTPQKVLQHIGGNEIRGFEELGGYWLEYPVLGQIYAACSTPVRVM